MVCRMWCGAKKFSWNIFFDVLTNFFLKFRTKGIIQQTCSSLKLMPKTDTQTKVSKNGEKLALQHLIFQKYSAFDHIHDSVLSRVILQAYVISEDCSRLRMNFWHRVIYEGRGVGSSSPLQQIHVRLCSTLEWRTAGLNSVAAKWSFQSQRHGWQQNVVFEQVARK